MTAIDSKRTRTLRPLPLVLSGLLTLPFFASSASRLSAAPPPMDDTQLTAQAYPAPTNRPRVRRGLSNQQKVAILVGAAALYYLYNRHRNAQGHGAQGQYYLSKNGRVYYRDAQGRPHWVTPPPGGIRVPESEAQRYRDFRGYNGRTTGRDLMDVLPGETQPDLEPVPAR